MVWWLWWKLRRKRAELADGSAKRFSALRL